MDKESHFPVLKAKSSAIADSYSLKERSFTKFK